MPDTLRNTFLSCFSRRCLIEKDLDVYFRIRSTVTLPTELQGRTEKVGDDFRW